MGDRRDRAVERMSNRLQSDKTSNRSKPSKTSETSSGTTGGEGQTESESSVKSRPSVLMYLPEDLRKELDIRFDELNAKCKREQGVQIEKNRDYYPAVVEAGLTGENVRDVLDI